jgi:acetyl esterase/lipase
VRPVLLALALALPLVGCASKDVYTPESTYRKLIGQYPSIRIASRTVPPDVTVDRALSYAGSRKLDIYRPVGVPAALPAALPVVVLVHGGGWRAGDRDNLAAMAIALAQRGYASVTVSYRLSGEAPYPAAVDDVRAAVLWLRAHAARYQLDPRRFALAGGSAGGQIASLAGVTGAAVQAVINIDGLSDFTSPAALLHEDDPAKKPSAAGAWFGGRHAEKSALWRDASPLTHVSAASPPMLFIVSAQPRFSVGREAMVGKLASHGVASEVLMLPDTPHSFWLFDPWLAPAVAAIDAFLMRALPAPD